MNWILTEGNKYLEDARLGKSYAEAIQLQNAHNQFEKQHHKVRVRNLIELNSRPKTNLFHLMKSQYMIAS